MSSFRSASPGTVRKRLLNPLLKRFRKGLRALAGVQIQATDRLFGMAAGNRLFWLSPLSLKSWTHAELRLFYMSRHAPELIAQFTELAFQHTKDPVTILNMARSGLTRVELTRHLSSIDFTENSHLKRHILASSDFSAAVIAAATLLLDDAAASRIVQAIDGDKPAVSRRRRALVDSIGYRPAFPPPATAQRGVAQSGFRSHKRNRLIIAPDFSDKRALSLLFGNADKVTLFCPDDLYGKADFSQTGLHNKPSHVSVEHPRSRITRFSSHYHKLHEDTRSAAQAILASIAFDPDGADMVGTCRPFAELALADDLFFRSLPLAALETLLAARDFDHIVVVNTNTPAEKGFVRLLAGLPNLQDHPLVEVVSLSRSMDVLSRFETFLRNIMPLRALTPANSAETVNFDDCSDIMSTQEFEAVTRSALHTAHDPTLRAMLALDQISTQAAERLPLWPDSGKPRVLLVAAQVSAYDGSTARFYNALNQNYDLRFAQFGGNLLSFSAKVAAAGGTLSTGSLVPIPIRTKDTSRAIQTFLSNRFTMALPDIDSALVRHVALLAQDPLVKTTLANYLTFYHTCDKWLTRLQDNGQKPGVVVMTPLRNSHVTAFCSLARAHDVPTIALEPHGLNAAYCRYSTVAADYYGVISSFFQDEAAAGFEIPRDRCVVVGSPRLRAPKDYDIDAARAAARQKLTDSQGLNFVDHRATLTFLSQPSSWDQIAEVWRIILMSVDELGVQVLLKTHPEETASRVAAYLRIAKDLGCLDRVTQVNTDATTAIEAADLVLSGYSATVVEATLLRHPVFCVTNGETDYPLDQHRVVDAPLFRTAPELRSAIEYFLETPEFFVAKTKAYLAREPQFLDGYEPYVTRLVDKVLAMPVDQAIRPAETLPKSAFLQGPHTVYDV